MWMTITFIILPPGKFLLEIKDRLVMDKIIIEKLSRQKAHKNKGYLLKLSWQKK